MKLGTNTHLVYREGLLILAIVLIVIGAVLLYAPIPDPAGTLGNIVLWIGIIVFIIWILLLVINAVTGRP